MVTPTAKRKALRAGLDHPGHEKVYCPKAGAYRLLRRDDDAGDGFGLNAGKFLWEERHVAADYKELAVHCVVEGVPLSGKSTVTRNMAEYCRSRGHPTRLMKESPESWVDADGTNLLDKQKREPILYSLHLQIMILLQQSKLIAEKGGYNGLVLQDRCALSIWYCYSVYVFAARTWPVGSSIPRR